MQPRVVPEPQRLQLSEFIAERMGLHFPPERWGDLERGLVQATGEFGFADVAGCADWLLSAPLTKAVLQVLANHLTTGETYFFRERKTFDALATSVVPTLMRLRRAGGQRLRIWSAGCCTGEEPYSLAILLHQIIPDLSDWHVTILATDINDRFLQKAAGGVYGEWSFRESPTSFKERYFERTADGHHAILPEIKKRVSFMQLNLAEDVYPSVATNTNAMDLIFCRNVLMYFTARQARKVVGNLRNAMVDDGWLVTGSSEGAHALNRGFVPVNFPGAIVYQKGRAKAAHGAHGGRSARLGETGTFPAPSLKSLSPSTSPIPAPPLRGARPARPVEKPGPAEPPLSPCAVAGTLYQQGHYAEAVTTLLNSFAAQASPDPRAFSLLARALANQGKLADAKEWCDRWVAADKLDPSGHYLRAVVLQELGDNEEAGRSLQRAIYLHPDFVLAHFAAANLARRRGKNKEATKHFANASHLLRDCPPGDLLPESDGLTAGRLAEVISSIIAMEGECA